MLYVDVPTKSEFAALRAARADICVSIVTPTTPVTGATGASRIAFRNAIAQVWRQLEGRDKRRVEAVMSRLEDVAGDDDFWAHQAHTLLVLAAPDQLHSFRLATSVPETLDVADRFYLKPLLRALAFPQVARVLALSEGAVRLIDVEPDQPAREVSVDALPRDGASAVGKATLNDRTSDGRGGGLEEQNVQLGKYVRAVVQALRPVVAGSDVPLILASTGRLESMFREMSSFGELLPETIKTSPDRLTPGQLAEAARPVLDAAYRRQIDDFATLFHERRSSGRATSDVSDAARAATRGAVATMLVNIDDHIPGLVDEDGGVTFARTDDATTYGVIDEIAGRALDSGARVLGVRASDLPEGAELAAVLRYPV